MKRALWAGALVFFVFGDIATTHAGLAVGAVETNGVVHSSIRQYGVGGMLGIKGAAVGLCYSVGKVARQEFVAPLVLSVVGAGLVAWNSLVVVAQL